jgi:NO-binding membrane sensor protein with MHYT domain
MKNIVVIVSIMICILGIYLLVKFIRYIKIKKEKQQKEKDTEIERYYRF